MGDRNVLLAENSEFSGDMVVEDVAYQGRMYRRLIFLAHPTIVQSEVELEVEGKLNLNFPWKVLTWSW
jgi:hypothetical protein